MSRRRFRNPRAFTLLELAIVVTVIGLLAMLALPELQRVVLRVQVNTVGNDLRVLGDAFKLHQSLKSAWPASSEPGVIPAGMQDYLRETAWTQRTPIGGHFSWQRDGNVRGTPFRAALRIDSLGDERITANYDQLVALDRAIDDGNLLTGALQVTAYPSLILILE